MDLSTIGILFRSIVAPKLQSFASSGIAFDKPPAPTSWIKAIGFFLSSCQH